MEENKKEYGVIGTVTIGTDEYRDLLEEKFEALKSKERWYNDYWEQRNKVTKLEEENKKLKEEFDKLKKFIAKNKALISEDGVTVMMAMFGEE